MNTGELIRKYRKLRGVTQAQLAEQCGMSDAAIRNYELGNRTPGEEQVALIASALQISPEMLREVPLESARQAMELLFRLSEEFGLVPVEIDGKVMLELDPRAEKAPKLDIAMRAWKAMLDSENAGEGGPASLLEWKAKLL